MQFCFLNQILLKTFLNINMNYIILYFPVNETVIIKFIIKYFGPKIKAHNSLTFTDYNKLKPFHNYNLIKLS